MAGEQRAHLLARLQVPPPQRPVTRPGQRVFSIRQQQHARHRRLMAGERLHKGAARGFKIRKPGPQLLTSLLAKPLAQLINLWSDALSQPAEELFAKLVRVPSKDVRRLPQSVGEQPNRDLLST